MANFNLLGDYIFKRIQKDNSDYRNTYFKPRESLTGLYISAKDKIERYWDFPEGKEE